MKIVPIDLKGSKWCSWKCSWKSKDNVDKQGLSKKIEDVDKKIPDTSYSNLVTITAFNTKIGEVENNIPPDVSGLVTNTGLLELGRRADCACCPPSIHPTPFLQ